MRKRWLPPPAYGQRGGFSGLWLLEVTAPASCIAAAAQLDARLVKHTVSAMHASENPDDARSDLWEKDLIFLVFWRFFFSLKRVLLYFVFY